MPPLLTQSKLYLDEVTRLRSGTGLAHPNSFPTVHDGCIPTPQENGDSGNAKLCPTTYPPKQKPTHANWVIPSPCSHGTSTLHTTHTHTVLHTHTVPHHTHAHTHAHTHTHTERVYAWSALMMSSAAFSTGCLGDRAAHVTHLETSRSSTVSFP